MASRSYLPGKTHFRVMPTAAMTQTKMSMPNTRDRLIPFAGKACRCGDQNEDGRVFEAAQDPFGARMRPDIIGEEMERQSTRPMP